MKRQINYAKYVCKLVWKVCSCDPIIGFIITPRVIIHIRKKIAHTLPTGRLSKVQTKTETSGQIQIHIIMTSTQYSNDKNEWICQPLFSAPFFNINAEREKKWRITTEKKHLKLNIVWRKYLSMIQNLCVSNTAKRLYLRFHHSWRLFGTFFNFQRA